jgi:hypothetical protein
MLKCSVGSPGRIRYGLAIALLVMFVWAIAASLTLYLVAKGYGLGGVSLRVSIAPERDVWIEVRGRRARVAESPEALKDAKWVTGPSSNPASEETPCAGPVELPLHGEKPGDWDAVAAYISRRGFGQGDLISWRLTKKDADGVEWFYYTDYTYVALGRAATSSPVLNIPPAETPKVEVTAQADVSDGSPSVGVAIELFIAPELKLAVIETQGRDVLAQVSVTDPDGRIVGKEEYALTDLGFT